MPYIDSNPMPLAQITERDQVRSHIVVDGDSLAKLAERYLDDPQRANELYELNRTLLSHPDVLPIGAEITIPARSANTLQSANVTPQSLRTVPAAIHAASRGGLVPVRPVPIGTGMVPRAQLSRPQPVAGNSGQAHSVCRSGATNGSRLSRATPIQKVAICESCFPWILGDVFFELLKLIRIADQMIEAFLLPKPAAADRATG